MGTPQVLKFGVIEVDPKAALEKQVQEHLASGHRYFFQDEFQNALNEYQTAKSDVYQGILGWTSYLMPMSWPGHAIGLVLFALNVVGYLVTFGQVDRLRIRDMQVDWKTGNIFTVGGWVGQLDGRAFNFGAFSFVNTARYVGGEIIPATFEHESGHMLSNAAFGFFQATRVFEGNGLDSFWERIAESNVPPGLRGTDPVTPEPDRPKIPQWG